MEHNFTIYYSEHVVHGTGLADWRAAPDVDVQVIVEWVQPDSFPWAGVTDRKLWTGEDVYDPFGYGVKFGAWMDTDAYMALWEVACGR